MEQGLGRSPPRIQQDKSCRWKYTEKLTLFSQINQTLHRRTPRTFIFHHLHVTRIVSSFSVDSKQWRMVSLVTTGLRFSAVKSTSASGFLLILPV